MGRNHSIAMGDSWKEVGKYYHGCLMGRNYASITMGVSWEGIMQNTLPITHGKE